MQVLNVFLSLSLITCLFGGSATRPYKSSPIQRIVVPYHRNIVSGHPYQYPKAVGESRHVIIPENINMTPNFSLDKSVMTMTGVHNVNDAADPVAMPVSFADGAYPVYYMPGNANGRFNGKISLLT